MASPLEGFVDPLVKLNHLLVSLGVHPVLRLQPLVDELVQQADVDRRLLVEGFCKITGELCVVVFTPGNLGKR